LPILENDKDDSLFVAHFKADFKTRWSVPILKMSLKDC
jgi:hypothetical protein